MRRVMRSAGSLAALSAGILLAAPATAADKHDAWINAFSDPAIQVTSVRQETNTTSTGQNFIQIIEARVNSDTRLRFIIQKGGSGIGFGRDGTDRHTRSLKSMSRYFNRWIRNDDATDYQRISAGKRRGATVDYDNGRCRAGLLGYRGSHPQTYELVLSAWVCGDAADKAVVSDYLTRFVPATRGLNLADDANARRLRGQSSPRGASGADNTSTNDDGFRSIRRELCEDAQGDATKMARFMGLLTETDLARFLEANQDCTLF